MRYLDELVMGDDLRKVETCKECDEEVKYKKGTANCGCNNQEEEED